MVVGNALLAITAVSTALQGLPLLALLVCCIRTDNSLAAHAPAQMATTMTSLPPCANPATPTVSLASAPRSSTVLAALPIIF